MSVPERADSGARPDPQDLARHYALVCAGLRDGAVTPFLGAGASLYGRPPDGEGWEGAPTAEELARGLIDEFRLHGEREELMRVAQHAYLEGSWGGLYRALHRRFATTFPPTELHDFLARTPMRFRERDGECVPPLIVTTNYDNLVEAAFTASGEAFDLVFYSADGNNKGRFCQLAEDGQVKPIDDPVHCLDVDPDVRPVILKMHGFVDPDKPRGGGDSYVITEDHYIDYLASTTDLSEKLPPGIVTRLEESQVLILGYSLRDWNVRAILRVLRTDWSRERWWAVLLDPDPLDVRSWAERKVTFMDMPLEEYVTGLRAFFDGWLEDT